MHVIATFNYSLHTELAVTELLEQKLGKEQIFVVVLSEIRGEKRNILDTINHADGVSMFDGGAILGTVLMTLGVIYGFIAEWGPIIWGLLGLVAGFSIGIILDYIVGRVRHSKNRRKNTASELIVMVNCAESQVDMVKSILQNHLALGIAVVGA